MYLLSSSLASGGHWTPSGPGVRPGIGPGHTPYQVAAAHIGKVIQNIAKYSAKYSAQNIPGIFQVAEEPR